jgi:predicted dehydrogenase/acetyltransferase-like isoleucine patch superfamily enzyme
MPSATDNKFNEPARMTGETLKIAVIGCGYWGKNLVRNFDQLGVLGAIHDADSELATVFSAQYGVPALGFEEVLERSEIAGVVIAAPAELHASLAMRALEANKHVFVEKPLALQISDAERVLALADETKRVLMVGHLLQYHPGFLKLREMVAKGQLGRIQYIYSNRLNLGKIRREENVFWSFAPHDLSMILTLAGELPDSVQATGSCYLHKVIADVTTTHLSFPSGINAHVFVSWLHPFKEQKLVVVGEDAMAVFDDRLPWSEKLALYSHEIEWRNGCPESHKADAEYVPLEESEPLQLECEHFLDSMANGERPRTDGAEGLRVLRVLAAAEQALAEGRIVSLNQPRSVAALQTHTEEAPAGDFVHESAYVDEGSEIGRGTRIWHFSHVLTGSRIGRNCTIGQNVMIGPDVTVGDNCKIQNNVSLYKGVSLEDGVFCGPSCVFTNVNTPRAEIERKDEFCPTPVRRGATIGANATIICGLEIGAYSFVAAGAVVARDVPPYALVAGVPARIAGWTCECGIALRFQSDQAVCSECGKRYEQSAEDCVGRVE